MEQYADIDQLLDQFIDGDGLETMKEIPPASIDLIFLHPPLQNTDWDDKGGYHEDVMIMMYDMLGESNRILKNGGALWMTASWKYTPLLYTHALDFGFHPQNEIIWHSTKGIGTRWRFSYRHQTIHWMSKGKDHKDYTFNLDDVRSPYKYKSESDNPKGMNPGDVWHVSSVHGNSHSRYPGVRSQIPEVIAMRAISSSTNKGDVILDPMCGSGTIPIVADRLERHWIGVDIDPKALDFATKRLDAPFDGWDSVDIRANRISTDRDWTVGTRVELRGAIRQNDPEMDLFDYDDE